MCKKFFLLATMLTIMSVSAWGQLSMQQNDKTLGKSNYVFLKQGNNGFRVEIKDYRSANFVSVFIGDDSEKAKLSLQQLEQWYKDHKVGESVLLDQDEKQLTVYKASPTLLLVSKGSAETCRASYQSMIKSLLVDERFGIGLVENTEVVGILTSTDLSMLNRKIKKVK